MGKKKIFKDDGVTEDFAAEAKEDQDTLPTDGSNVLDDGGIAPGSEDAPAAEETDTKERDDAALENPAVAPAGDNTVGGFELPSDKPADNEAPVDQAHDATGESADITDVATPESDVLGEAAKPPEEVPAEDPVGTAVQGSALAGDSDAPAHAGSDVVPTPNPEPAAAEVTEPAEGKDEPAEATPGEDTGSATAPSLSDDAEPGKPADGASSTDSSEPQPASSSEDSPATEPEMPALADVHPEAAPIAEAAGTETMGKFKDAGNLMTEGLAALRGVEEKLEELGDEAKARLAHLRHKASEALAALEAWFSRS